MWWKTTEVYRVSLPYSEIEALTDTPIATQAKVFIYTWDRTRSSLLATELSDAFSNNSKLIVEFEPVALQGDQQSHTPTTREELMKRFDPLEEGTFMFMEWRNLTEEVLVTSSRSAFMAPETSYKKMEQVLRTWILQEHRLNLVSPSIKTFDELKESRGGIGEATQPQTDVVLTVINPNAELQTVAWDVQAAAANYLNPFLEQLNDLSRFNLKTQWKYQTSINLPLSKVTDNSRLGRHYELPEEYLTHFVTSLERSIGNGITTNPNIQIIVYVPPCKFSPMRIRSPATVEGADNIQAFLSSKWGGVIIYNPPEDVCASVLEISDEQRATIEVNSHDVMTVALFLMRRLVNVDVYVPIPGANIEALNQLAPRDWERDAYLRVGIINLLNSVTITLKSLIQLLNDINYIVINDAVGQAIKEANRNIRIAKTLFRENKLLEATHYAKEAFKYSEMAFFDPSLLALLYFPGEQKYAIYIPLFLPIMIPVVLSIRSFRKGALTAKKD